MNVPFVKHSLNLSHMLGTMNRISGHLTLEATFRSYFVSCSYRWENKCHMLLQNTCLIILGTRIQTTSSRVKDSNSIFQSQRTLSEEFCTTLENKNKQRWIWKEGHRLLRERERFEHTQCGWVLLGVTSERHS